MYENKKCCNRQIEPDIGENIYSFVSRVIDMLSYFNYEDKCVTFNEIELKVSPKSYVNDIVTIYNLKHELRQIKKEK